MKYVLYGLPCAGKTTVMTELNIPVIHGSVELNKLSSGKFSDLPDVEKNQLRIRYAQQLSSRNDSFISDGHYSFLDDVVFTQADAVLYDVFIYLYCNPEIIHQRLQHSEKNTRFADLSVERIKKWQEFEIEQLRIECHKQNKDFYVVQDITASELQDFLSRIEEGYSSYLLAESIVKQIKTIYPEPCELHICDGDKTLIEQDSFRVCTENYVTSIFNGNFYTGYQSLCFSLETNDMSYDLKQLDTVHLNNMVFSKIKDKNYVVLSSGIYELWKQLAMQFCLQNVIADSLISADTKFFVVKLLQEYGYIIYAYGDGKNDLYMLKQADKGVLCVSSCLSHSLRDADTSGIQLLYDKSPYILSKKCTDVADDIAVCKSSSGINGARLADVHIRLGKRLGEVIHSIIPNDNAAVLVLERGGRFFGDGLYTGFGGTFYSVNPKLCELSDIQHSVIVIVDSVINTGRSVLTMIDALQRINPDTEICIAANVIQDDALRLLCNYKVFAVRTSSNYFIGTRQMIQKDGKGPDTADRLFNYI